MTSHYCFKIINVGLNIFYIKYLIHVVLHNEITNQYEKPEKTFHIYLQT